MVDSISPVSSATVSRRSSVSSLASVRSTSSTNTQQSDLSSNRAGYAPLPGSESAHSSSSHVSARASRDRARLQRERPEEADHGGDEHAEAVIAPYDANMGFAQMQTTQ